MLCALQPLADAPLLSLRGVVFRLRPEGIVSVPHAVSRAVALDPPHRLVPLAGFRRITRSLPQLALDVVGRRDPGGGRGDPFALGEEVFGYRHLGAGFVADLGQLLALGSRRHEPLKRVFFV